MENLIPSSLERVVSNLLN